MPSRFVPTEEQRRQVRMLAGLGMKQAQIASLAGIHSAVTLRKHFRTELLEGQVAAAVKVRRTLYEMSVSGRNPAATMFWLKTRDGWSEKGKEPELFEEQEKPPSIAVHFVKPNRHEETGELLEPVRGEEQDWEYRMQARMANGFQPGGRGLVGSRKPETR